MKIEKETSSHDTFSNDINYEKEKKDIIKYDVLTESDIDTYLDYSYLYSDEEEFASRKNLTTLVRRAYWQRLHKSLMKNYEVWLEKSMTLNKVESPCSPTHIALCAATLERKALRACMMADIYQQTMVHMIKEIRKSSEQHQLYNNFFRDQLNLVKSKWRDKKTQTGSAKKNNSKKNGQYNHESVINKGISNGINSFPKECLGFHGELAESISSDPTTDLAEELNGGILLEGQKKGPDICLNKPINSDKLVDDAIFKLASECDNVNFREKRKMPVLDENISHSKKIKKKIKNESDKCHERKSSLDDRLEQFSILFGESESVHNLDTVNESTHDLVTVEEANPEVLNSTKLNYSDFEWNINSPRQLLLNSQVFEWHKEMTARICNLKKILLSMTPKKRMKLNKRFLHLFGEEIDYVQDISSVELICCRKRVADLVVSELTRYYVTSRIGSREVFKQLARQVTNDIMDKNLAPDILEVKEYVDDIFSHGKQINSLEDIVIL